MKFNILLVVSLVVLGVQESFAYVDCRDTSQGCTIAQLVDIGDAAPTSKEDRVQAYQQAIAKITAKIKELSGTNSGASSSLGINNCLMLKNNLWIGKKDGTTNGEVTILQKYLVSKGFLNNSLVSGYYGNMTAQAVVRLQKSFGMDFVTVSSGVGAATRAKIQEESCVGS